MVLSGGALGFFASDRRATGTASGPRCAGMRSSRAASSTASAPQRSERTTFTVVPPSVIIRSFGWSFLSVSGAMRGGMNPEAYITTADITTAEIDGPTVEAHTPGLIGRRPVLVSGRCCVISLFRRYWDDLVSIEGGLSLLWMDGLLLIPLIMAAFFYPVEAAIAAGALLVVSLAGYEGWVLWRKRHTV